MKSIGVDVGGTFTDLVYCDMATGELSVHKVATTPADPSLGVMTGIAQLCDEAGVAPSAIDYVFHGTTTATNAVLEHKGARTGMITNEGFRDILHIARHQRVEHYSIMQELPWQNRPLIQRRYRKVVKGRLIPPRGEELEPLDEEAVRRAAIELREEGVELGRDLLLVLVSQSLARNSRARESCARRCRMRSSRLRRRSRRNSASLNASRPRRSPPSSAQECAATSIGSPLR